MKKLFFALTIMIGLISCSSAPQPINYGKDNCDYCSMTIMDEKFGAELINQNGKPFKFDSGECMMSYLAENKGIKFSKSLIINYSEPKELIDVTQAFFVHGGDVESPMGGQLAAFKSQAAAEKFQQEKKANLLKWDELQSVKF